MIPIYRKLTSQLNRPTTHRYKLVGNKFARCNKNKQFDTILPTCEEVTCPQPEQRDHMITTTYPEVTDGKYKLFTEIEYECDDGKMEFYLDYSYFIILFLC